jgi:hypothetical protein
VLLPVQSNVRVISMSSTWVGLSVLAPPGLVGLNLRYVGGWVGRQVVGQGCWGPGEGA